MSLPNFANIMLPTADHSSAVYCSSIMGSCISNFINAFQTEVYRYIGNRIEIVLAEDREDARVQLLRTEAEDNIVLNMEDGVFSEEGEY